MTAGNASAPRALRSSPHEPGRGSRTVSGQRRRGRGLSGVHSAKLEDPAAAALSAALGDIGTPQKLPSMDLLT